MSCLGRTYPFSLRVRRLARRHSKGVEYGGSGLEAVDPMATMGCGGNPHCPNVSGRVRGNRRSVQPFGTSSSRAGDRERPKPEVYSAAWDVSPQAGDWEGPVSAHPLLGPRRWSPGRAGPKAKGTYPISCRPGGWSVAWVRGYRGGGARGDLNGECWGTLTSSPTLGTR